MGIDKLCLLSMLREGKKRKFEGSVLTLGRQDIFFSLGELKELAEKENYSLHQPLNEELSLIKQFKEKKYISDVCLFKNIGFSDVKSLDYSELELADYVFDLNNDKLPDFLCNKFDVIIDGGTIEHIFHLPNVLNNIFKMLKKGGRIIHYSASVNYLDHGFYMFSPTFFWDFYYENNFEINTLKLVKHPLQMNKYWKSIDYKPTMIDLFNFRPQKKHLYIIECVVTKNEQSTGDKIPQQFYYADKRVDYDVIPLIGDVDSYQNKVRKIIKYLKKAVIKVAKITKKLFVNRISLFFFRLFKKVVIKVLRKVKNFFFSPESEYRYQIKIAPFLAKYFFWLYWPFYLILKLFKICFLVNIAGPMGHLIVELDYFFRKKKSKEIDATKRYVWINLPDEYNEFCVKSYKHFFWLTLSNKVYYYLLYPILIYYKDITISCALSRIRWQLDENKKYYPCDVGQTYLHQVTKRENNLNWLNYFQLRNITKNFCPLKLELKNKNDKLLKFLNTDKKIALIHIKVGNPCNAVAQKTDPKTYINALKFLEEKNYQLVFVGREKMPSVFNNLPIINYAQSEFATFENDVKLFNIASLAIINGSGLAYLADCINLPYLYVNSWHMHCIPPSETCIVIPTLVKEKRTNKYLTFTDQISLYENLKDVGAEIFPKEKYEPYNASADEIVGTVKELLDEGTVRNNSLQKKMRKKHFLINNSMASYSQYFLNNHLELL